MYRIIAQFRVFVKNNDNFSEFGTIKYSILYIFLYIFGDFCHFLTFLGLKTGAF